MIDIFDNRTKLLGDDLKRELKQGSKVRIAASCFSMYAFDELKKELGQIEELQFLFTEPTFTKEKVSENLTKKSREFYIPKLQRENNLYGSDFEIKLKNKMNMRAIARECAAWVRTKVKFHSNTTRAGIPNFIGIDSGDAAVAYTPVGGFTTAELGIEKGNDLFSVITKHKSPEISKHLFKLFDEVWKDTKVVEDVTDTIVEFISTAFNDNAPEFIYYVVLYNIFAEFLDDLSEDNMPNEATGDGTLRAVWGCFFYYNKRHDEQSRARRQPCRLDQGRG